MLTKCFSGNSGCENLMCRERRAKQSLEGMPSVKCRVGPLISHSKGACSSKGVIKPQSLTDKQQYLENTDLTCSVKLHFSV